MGRARIRTSTPKPISSTTCSRGAGLHRPTPSHQRVIVCLWSLSTKPREIETGHGRARPTLRTGMYGLGAQEPEALNEALWRAIESMHRTLYAPSRDELTPSELALLDQAGVDVEESPRREDPMMVYATEFGAILATSLSPARAGERLGGVTAVRVRQMIRERTVYALRLEGRWKIPLFQFQDEGLVPSPEISPASCCGRRSMRCDRPYSLKPLRRSVGYAFASAYALFRSVRPVTAPSRRPRDESW